MCVIKLCKYVCTQFAQLHVIHLHEACRINKLSLIRVTVKGKKKKTPVK